MHDANPTAEPEVHVENHEQDTDINSSVRTQIADYWIM